MAQIFDEDTINYITEQLEEKTIEYIEKSTEGNTKGGFLYVVYDKTNKNIEFVLAERNYYLTQDDFNYTDGTINPNYEPEDVERIALLNLTAADVERAIYKAKGLDFDDIIKIVETTKSVDIDIKALKIELRANNFYRGNPYIEKVGELLGFTSKQLDEFFETNDYTKLLNE